MAEVSTEESKYTNQLCAGEWRNQSENEVLLERAVERRKIGVVSRERNGNETDDFALTSATHQHEKHPTDGTSA